jgi:hypothetical protein
MVATGVLVLEAGLRSKVDEDRDVVSVGRK